MGPNANTGEYPPWHVQLPSLLCPSDGTRPVNQGDTNYAINWGDNGAGVRRGNRDRARGVAVQGQYLGVQDMRDGSSNTLLFSEVGRDGRDSKAFQGGILRRVTALTFDDATGYGNPSACLDAAADPNNPGRYPAATTNDNLINHGENWAHGDGHQTGFTTIIAPNGPSCSSNEEVWVDVILTPGSYHSGGVQAVMADGSVQFINDTIDTVTPNRASEANVVGGKSPYGVWGALGTRAGGEAVDDGF